MREKTVNGKNYRLPNAQNPFQEKMYIHLINWKWENITKEEGYYGDEPYDAILPESEHENFPVIYPGAVETLKQHHDEFPFRYHRHFHHVVSSQAANFNLFLTLLRNPLANEALRQIKPDFKDLDTSRLDNGFQVEFRGTKDGPGLLGDHTSRSGTDSDIAIAYYNNSGESCLWLIEHKLTEKEFTECNASRSKGRNPLRHICSKTYSEILGEKGFCYYHDVRRFRYWDITDKHREFFINHTKSVGCPFRGGTNQLWRNQLLALTLEDDINQPYQHVYFTVVKHPENTALDKTIDEYKKLIGNNEKFSTFTSADVIKAAENINDAELNKWTKWYRELIT